MKKLNFSLLVITMLAGSLSQAAYNYAGQMTCKTDNNQTVYIDYGSSNIRTVEITNKKSQMNCTNSADSFSCTADKTTISLDKSTERAYQPGAGDLIGALSGASLADWTRQISGTITQSGWIGSSSHKIECTALDADYQK